MKAIEENWGYEDLRKLLREVNRRKSWIHENDPQTCESIAVSLFVAVAREFAIVWIQWLETRSEYVIFLVPSTKCMSQKAMQLLKSKFNMADRFQRNEWRETGRIRGFYRVDVGKLSKFFKVKTQRPPNLAQFIYTNEAIFLHLAAQCLEPKLQLVTAA